MVDHNLLEFKSILGGSDHKIKRLSSTEGECKVSSSGVLMRTGWGTQQADGVTYTGEWLEDKVTVICGYLCVCIYSHIFSYC